MVNPVMPYAWGSKTFIAELLGKRVDDLQPQAELWMGAHPAASSQIQNGVILADLNYIIAEDPNDFLGSRIAHAYHDHLPFMLKVLAAEQPLSLQVHPDSEKAKEGFTRENKLGIPLTAPIRNYKDSFHKPELLVALTEFHALCGFRDYSELTHLLKKYLHKIHMAEIDCFIDNPTDSNLKEMFGFLLRAKAETKTELLENFMQHVHSEMPADPQEQLVNEWSAQLYKLYPNDVGVLAPLLMNIVVLKPGQGIYLESGILHSYLKGAGMEIMANSDNVLRGGLTPKHVDPDELLRVLNWSGHKADPLRAKKLSATEYVFQTPALEFVLSRIRHSTNKRTELQPSQSPEILFCYEGGFEVENCSQILSLDKGQSLFVPYEVEGYAVQGKGLIFRARCNV